MQTIGTGAAVANFLFQIGSYRSIIFDFGIDVSSWTFEFYLKRNKGDRKKTLSLTLGSGLSFPIYETDQIQAVFTQANTSIEEGEYYFEFRRTDVVQPIVNGNAYFSFDAPQGTTSESALSLTVDTQVINLTISSVTGSGGGSPLTPGNGTTVNDLGTGVDLGGTLTEAVEIDGDFNFNLGQTTPIAGLNVKTTNDIILNALTNFAIQRNGVNFLRTYLGDLYVSANGVVNIEQARLRDGSEFRGTGFTPTRIGLSTNDFTFDFGGGGVLKLNLAADATGDIYYRNASGNFVRLPIGTEGQVLTVVSGLPVIPSNGLTDDDGEALTTDDGEQITTD